MEEQIYGRQIYIPLIFIPVLEDPYKGPDTGMKEYKDDPTPHFQKQSGGVVLLISR